MLLSNVADNWCSVILLVFPLLFELSARALLCNTCLSLRESLFRFRPELYFVLSRLRSFGRHTYVVCCTFVCKFSLLHALRHIFSCAVGMHPSLISEYCYTFLRSLGSYMRRSEHVTRCDVSFFPKQFQTSYPCLKVLRSHYFCEHIRHHFAGWYIVRTY